jgi:adhesin/invasin
MTIRALIVPALAAAASAAAGSTPASADTTCPTYNPPTTLTLVAGTPQSAKLGTPFGTNFRVTLVNSNSCPITTPLAGIAVTFAAPGSGPSGTFASSGANAVLVGTDGTGSATAPNFMANSLPGGYLVTASSDYGSITFSVVNTAVGVPATVTALSPVSEKATVSARYAKPFQVKVLDGNGAPVQGADVTFALGTGTGATPAGASFVGGQPQATATTDASGLATSPHFTANANPGRFAGTVTVAGIATPVMFALDNLRTGQSSLAAIASPRQTATVDARFARPLVARVRDGSGKPMAGVTVSFSLGAGAGGGTSAAGGSFVGGATQATATTNVSGLATSPRIVANTVAGSFTATATAAMIPGTATFAFRSLAAKASTVTAGAAANESAAPGHAFSVPLGVQVEDAHGNPVRGAAVTFSAPARGASGRFRGSSRTVTVKTNVHGVAVAPAFVANRKEGGYVVRATVHGVSGAAAFALVNEPAA